MLPPPQITSWSKVSIMEASHFDKEVAYAAVNRIRLDDPQPHIYKTTDGGKTWKEIVSGLSADPINSVKEDTQIRGLLFAGSERFVNVSFDDGEHWQSLQLNMPCTSIRDLVIKDDDLVVGTHGRSFWILDNITPLRQIKEEKTSQAILYKPQTALRIRWNLNPDTPLPQEEPAGENPPDGAIIDYYLKSDAREVSLEILNEKNEIVRKYSSKDKPYNVPELNIPLYWIRPQQMVSTSKGHHRFLWDMKYQPLNVEPSFPISAIYKNTPPEPTAPWVLPAEYQIKLTIDGQIFSQKLAVKMDPRVQSTSAQLQEQFTLSMICYHGRKNAEEALALISGWENQLSQIKVSGSLEKNINEFKIKMNLLKGSGGWGRDLSAMSWNNLATKSEQLFTLLQGTDMPVTSQARQAVKELEPSIQKMTDTWKTFLTNEIPKINSVLKSKGVQLKE